MADYYPLIARAIAGLDKNTGEARRALYERARTALVAQLRGVDPPLPEAEITRERLALEEGIRKVEAEAARRSRVDTSPAAAPPAVPPQPPSAPGAPRPGARMPPGTLPNLPSRGALQGAPQRPGPAATQNAPFGAPSGGLEGSPPGAPRGVPPGPGRPAPIPGAPPRPPVPKGPAFDGPPPPLPGGPRARDPFSELPPAQDFDQLEPRLAQEDFSREQRIPGHGTETQMDPFRQSQPPHDRGPHDRGPYGSDHDEDEFEEPGKRSMGGLIKLAVAGLILIAAAGFVYSQRGMISEVWQAFFGPSTQVAEEGQAPGTQPADTNGRPKITDRLGSQTAQPAGPAVAQRVVLYEEEPNDPQGKRFVGSVIWRTETVSPGQGRPPELAVRADVEIPERRMTMTFSIRRNTDQTLPASHTIEVMFNLPADFPSGGIQNVPGVLMKQAEQTRGTPLAGLAVKVTNNFFLIGLSAVEADMQRNIQLLKERAWFDIPVVYNNNRRAILAIEKGTPGERAFAEAFAAWKE